MRWILKLVARMYPAAWRARYGTEYEALLEDADLRGRDVVDVFWEAVKMQVMRGSLVKVVLPCALLGGLVALGISFSRPILYRSRTVVLVSTSDPQLIDQELAGRTREALTAPNLVSIIEEENLYPSERKEMPMGGVVDLMRRNVSILPLAKNGGDPASGFEFEFAYPDAHVAQRVDGELVSRMIAANLQAAIAHESADWPRATFTIRGGADLPQKPFLPNRWQFGAGGIVAGLAGGLIMAVVRSRRGAAPVHD